jgi:sulfate transport system substrate-binding protein
MSIRAEPHVAVVDKNVDRKRTRPAAEAYMKFLYTPEAQDIIVQNFYRPTAPEALAKHAKQFPNMKLFSITDIGKNWADAFKQLVGDGGVFDSIYKPRG